MTSKEVATNGRLTFGNLLNIIQIVRVRLMVTTANTRYHHQEGLASRMSTFIPKRPYVL
jgi:hypothetical protein